MKYNQLDGKVDRRSFTGFYYIDPITNRPRNPIGRTGSKNLLKVLPTYSIRSNRKIIVLVTGRGRLYHWGPNHAGDPVVTRYR